MARQKNSKWNNLPPAGESNTVLSLLGESECAVTHITRGWCDAATGAQSLASDDRKGLNEGHSCQESKMLLVKVSLIATTLPMCH